MTFSGKDPMAKPEAIRMSLAKYNVFLRLKGLLSGQNDHLMRVVPAQIWLRRYFWKVRGPTRLAQAC